MTRIGRTAMLVAGALGFAWAVHGSAVARAQGTTRASLLVLSKGDLTLSVVDTTSGRVVGKAPSGPDPHEVAVSSDGRTAYIANYNGGVNRISVVDLTTMQATPAIDLGALRAPHGLAFVGGKLWFTAEGAKVFGTYDPATSRVDFVLGTGQNRTHMIWVSPDQSRVITTNVNSATVTIADRTIAAGRGGGPAAPGRGGPQTDWDETVVPVGRGDEGFDVSPDGRQIWTANAQDGTISIIDASSKRVSATLAADVGTANRLKFTPDGRLVLVSMLNNGNLAVIDAATHQVTKRIPIGHGAAGIEIPPEGRRAYVACTPDDYVTVIDLKSLTVAGHIDAGKQPDGMAWRR